MRRLLFRYRPLQTVLLAGLLLIPVGCSKTDRPPIGTVTGMVYLDGQPLDGAIVFFSPDDRGRVSECMTKKDGSYDLVYIGKTHGAKVGKHHVSITTAYEGVDTETGKTIVKKEVVPRKYNGGSSELVVDVKPGRNVHDFKLESK